MKNRLQTIAESLNESADNDTFKDTNGKTPKVGDFIVDDNGDVGKVKSFGKDKDGGRMLVDFRSHTLELNPKSTFEITEVDDKVKKAFEAKKKGPTGPPSDKEIIKFFSYYGDISYKGKGANADFNDLYSEEFGDRFTDEQIDNGEMDEAVGKAWLLMKKQAK